MCYIFVLPDANLYRSIIDLFAAGTDTTATTLDWALMFMIAYPGMQDKCRKEIEDVIPLGVPHMLAKDIKINGYAVPKGTMLLSNQQAIHFNKSYWDEPAKFNPERFLDADGNIKKTDKLIPFSVGPRICLGESLARMELFLFFANLIQRFTFTKAEEDDILDFNGVLGVTLRTKPYKLRVKVN
ncbi:hypothetical protein KUTeg_009529 [Tegillarca granosa]|uniref:Uncharacterized protein n=1 Tax=Tegillarca granosa TaxID=220873 RepID=A0ABQ9F451_TEGGR|nr:hypothetical protein KUTeg_009529 [Tegillarca granosa]